MRIVKLGANQPHCQNAEIAIALPDFATYRSLVDRTAISFNLLGFGVYLVSEEGGVAQRISHQAVEATPPPPR